jgi:hypothetical protein
MLCCLEIFERFLEKEKQNVLTKSTVGAASYAFVLKGWLVLLSMRLGFQSDLTPPTPSGLYYPTIAMPSTDTPHLHL